MASNRPAPEAPYAPGVFSEEGAERSVGEWNPTAETVRPVRGRHRQRVMKQRGGFARSSTVLGVGVIAAVGAGGIATAQNKPAVSITLPDMGSLLGDDEPQADESASYEAMGLAAQAAEAPQQTAAEALRSRILEQADQQTASAADSARAAAERKAAEQAAAAAEKAEKEAEAEAKAKKDAAKKKAEKLAAEKAEKQAEAERRAKLAKSFALPTSSYQLTASYGQAGSMWSSGYHTGLDFAAPAGTPTKAVGTGTVQSAGWSGAYGYAIVLQLTDGTEVLYAHLSSMAVGAGQKVTAGEMIGRVGDSGNTSGAHLHLEVKTPGGAGLDPMSWLQSKGLRP